MSTPAFAKLNPGGKLRADQYGDDSIPAGALVPYVPTRTIYATGAPGEITDNFTGSLNAMWTSVGGGTWAYDGSGNLWRTVTGGGARDWLLTDVGSPETPLSFILSTALQANAGVVFRSSANGENGYEISLDGVGLLRLRKRVANVATVLVASLGGAPFTTGTTIDVSFDGDDIRIEIDGNLVNGGVVTDSTFSEQSYAGFTATSTVGGSETKWDAPFTAGYLGADFDGCDWLDLDTNTRYINYSSATTSFAESHDEVPVASLTAKLGSTYQPLDSDLTAIAALSTTSYGRAFLALADAAAARTAIDAAPAASKVWIGAALMAQGNGVAAIVTSGGQARTRRWNFDAASEERTTFELELPSDWTTYSVHLWWSNAGAGAGDVVWDFRQRAWSAGDDVGSAGGTANGNVTATAGATDILVRTLLATGCTIVAEPQTGNLLRRAADGADTLANDAGAYWLEFTKLT